jgi:hypothetical protein
MNNKTHRRIKFKILLLLVRLKILSYKVYYVDKDNDSKLVYAGKSLFDIPYYYNDGSPLRTSNIQVQTYLFGLFKLRKLKAETEMK